MSGINKAILVGNLGQAPDTRYMANGDPVCNFSLATSEKWRDRTTGETKEAAEWPGTWIRVQCIDGKYPDWRRVIPNPDHCKASCAGSCAEWAKVIHAASSVGEDKYRACRLEWDKGQVQVTSSGLRGEYAGQLPTSELTGDGIQGVALDYLNGALGSLSGDRVLLQLINESFLLTQPDFDGVRVIMGMRT